MIDFKTTPEDGALIDEIIYRARALGIHKRLDVPAFTLQMDITAHHNASGGLDLRALLDAPDVDFAHDIAGMRSHMDTATGLLRDCFVPRCGYVSATAHEVTP